MDAATTAAGCGALKNYVTNTEKLEPEYVDFFNAGQKLYFWAIVGDAP